MVVCGIASISVRQCDGVWQSVAVCAVGCDSAALCDSARGSVVRQCARQQCAALLRAAALCGSSTAVCASVCGSVV